MRLYCLLLVRDDGEVMEVGLLGMWGDAVQDRSGLVRGKREAGDVEMLVAGNQVFNRPTSALVLDFTKVLRHARRKA
jgi:hypothetical protein